MYVHLNILWMFWGTFDVALKTLGLNFDFLIAFSNLRYGNFISLGWLWRWMLIIYYVFILGIMLVSLEVSRDVQTIFKSTSKDQASEIGLWKYFINVDFYNYKN